MRLKFLNIITIVFLALISGISHAQDLDIQDVEQALGIKAKDNCTTPPCPADSDAWLNQVLSDHVQKREDSQSNDIEKTVDKKPAVTIDKAELIVLNKITAKSQKLIFTIGEVKFFGNISVEVHQCIKSTDPFNANNLMLLTVFDNKIEDENLSIFHGWVFSSNPSLSTIEHPVYEVLPVQCLSAEQE